METEKVQDTSTLEPEYVPVDDPQGIYKKPDSLYEKALNDFAHFNNSVEYWTANILANSLDRKAAGIFVEYLIQNADNRVSCIDMLKPYGIFDTDTAYAAMEELAAKQSNSAADTTTSTVKATTAAYNENEEDEYVQITNQDGVEVNVLIDDEGELACKILQIYGNTYVILAVTEDNFDEVIAVFLGDKQAAYDAIKNINTNGGVYVESVTARKMLKFEGESIIGVPKDLSAIEYLNDMDESEI